MLLSEQSCSELGLPPPSVCYYDSCTLFQAGFQHHGEQLRVIWLLKNIARLHGQRAVACFYKHVHS